MREYYQIIVKPLLTEKSIGQKEKYNRYSFVVAKDANKIEIRQAVEAAFSLKNKVLSVDTMNMAGKFKKRGRKGGYRPDWKKAVVTLVKGASIAIFDEA
jgi:large subunit ribosomal protein L23